MTRLGQSWAGYVCKRCGAQYGGESCVHTNTQSLDVTPAHAERIRAVYAFGKRFNPDHDETNYFDMTRDPVTDFKERARSTG